MIQFFCEECASLDHNKTDCPLLISCENCYAQDHDESNCPLPKQVRCKECNRANTRTRECDCQKGLWKDMQTLRLVGYHDNAVPLVDVTMYAHKYVALVATGQPDTYMSPQVVKDYIGTTYVSKLGLYDRNNKLVAFQLHLNIGNRLILHPCFIKSDIAYDLVLGMDFLLRYGFGLRIGKTEINNFSPTFSTAQEIRYWMNRYSNDNNHPNQTKQLVKLNRHQLSTRVLSNCRRLTPEEYAEMKKKEKKEKELLNQKDVLSLYASESDLDFD